MHPVTEKEMDQEMGQQEFTSAVQEKRSEYLFQWRV